MESKAKACSKVHAVCIPSPFQSHIKVMLQSAKLLHHKGFHITFVNTEFNHRRFLKSRGEHSLGGLPSFRFEAIPDGLPASSDESSTTQDMYSLCESIMNNVMLHPFLDLLAKLNDSSNSVNPAVSCIISDGFLPFTVTAAQQLGLPIVLLFTISACSFMGFKQFRTFKEKGLFPVDGTFLFSFCFFLESKFQCFFHVIFSSCDIESLAIKYKYECRRKQKYNSVLCTCRQKLSYEGVFEQTYRLDSRDEGYPN